MANFGAAAVHFDWLADGKTVLTGIGLAYLSVEATKLALGIRVKTGDDYALPLALALAVGRWGCFINGCCFGTPTTLPWAVVFHDGLPRHPTQIYESFFHLFMAAVLLFLARKQMLPTHRLQIYLIAYCLYRFLTEYIRPEPSWLLGLTFYQWTALAFWRSAGQWVWDDFPEGRCKLFAESWLPFIGDLVMNRQSSSLTPAAALQRPALRRSSPRSSMTQSGSSTINPSS